MKGQRICEWQKLKLADVKVATGIPASAWKHVEAEDSRIGDQKIEVPPQMSTMNNAKRTDEEWRALMQVPEKICTGAAGEEKEITCLREEGENVPMRGGAHVSLNTINEDLRTIKTKKAMYAAIFSLLTKHHFKKITVKEVCEEALVSRATFYAHFTDKYDLLKLWITEFWLLRFDGDGNYEQIERFINCHIHDNASVLKNLVYEADNETFEILFECILSTINLNFEKNHNEDMYPRNIVLSHFYAGGIMSYLSWQVKNKFPSDVPPMNRYLYEIIQGIRDWQSN